MAARTILIIDPDDASRTYVARALAGRGFATLPAPTGREGMLAALQHKPALIIVDPALRDVSAEDFARALRQDENTAAMPLIALSSIPDPARAHSCLAAGFDEYIRKSSEAMPALMAALEALLTPAAAPTPVASAPLAAPPPPVPVAVAPPPALAATPPTQRAASAAVVAPPGAAPLVASGTPDDELHGRKGGLLFTFLSAKGGTGTSSLCANLAMNLAVNQPEASVAVVDMVLPIGSIAPIVGYEGRQDIVAVADLPPAQIAPEFFRERLAEV